MIENSRNWGLTRILFSKRRVLSKGNALDLLKEINDIHFTTENGNYNLEINLDSFELKDDCIFKLHQQLKGLLEKVKTVAEKHHTKIVLTGI